MLILSLRNFFYALGLVLFFLKLSFAEDRVDASSGFDMGDDFWQEANSKIKPVERNDNKVDNSSPPTAEVVLPAPEKSASPNEPPSISNLPDVSLPSSNYDAGEAQSQRKNANNVAISPAPLPVPQKNLAEKAPEVQLPSAVEMQKLEQGVKQDTKLEPEPSINDSQPQPVKLPDDANNATTSATIASPSLPAPQQSSVEKAPEISPSTNKKIAPPEPSTQKQNVAIVEPDAKSDQDWEKQFSGLESREFLAPSVESAKAKSSVQPSESSPTQASSGSGKTYDKQASVAKPMNAISTKNQEPKTSGTKTPPFAIPMPSEDDDDKFIELDISPREVYDYRTTILPPSISKKKYSEENQHLPKVFYQDEYTKFLFIAVVKGDLGGVKALLFRGANINAQDTQNSYTPLMYAVANNKLQVARYLIARGADVNIVTYDGQNALHIACIYNRSEMIRLLVTAGIDPAKADNKGNKPLSLLTKDKDSVALQLISGYQDMDKALLACTNMSEFSCVQHALNRGAMINTKNKEGDTALIIAARNNNIDIVNLLLNYGADANIRNKKDQEAANLARQNGNKNMADIIETAKIKKELTGHQLEEYLGFSADNVKKTSTASEPTQPKSLFTKRKK